ncbi:MAG: M48 family metalloprotease, partial [Gammaproteobacteria bacterium]|nr:M48 family metalloprotease [Gammaproteobacteria bacterium]
ALLLMLHTSATVFAEDEDFRKRSHHHASDLVTESDIQTEIKFGRDVAARILGKYPLSLDSDLTRYVNLVGKSIAQQAGRPELVFRFAVLEADFVNAYSAPGGYVFISKGAIKKMQDESELAAALAHEVAHITQRHIVKEFKIKGKDDSSTSGLTKLIGGSQDAARVAFNQAVDSAMKVLFERGYKHEDEINADQEAILLLAASSYDPTALQRYLERIHKSSKTSSHKTHPPSTKRVNAVATLLREEGLDKVKYTTAKERFTTSVKGKL